MYGLPQIGKLANDLLISIIGGFGYFPCQYTKVLWRNKWYPIVFILVVDDFGIKFYGIQRARHLKEALKTYHEVSVEWGEFVLRSESRLVIKGTNFQPIHACLHYQSTNQVPTCYP